MEYTHPDIRVPSHLCGSTAGGLKSFTIDASFCILAEGQADLLVLLKTTPLLSRLSISCQCMRERNDSGGIFLGLNANMNPSILPCLTSLNIRFINAAPYLEPSFVEMVQSQFASLPPSVSGFALLGTYCNFKLIIHQSH